MRFSCSADKLVPQLDVNRDMGNFVYAVAQMAPGKAYMAGQYLSFKDWAAAWGRVTGKTISYKEVTREEMIADTPDKAAGLEVALMFEYSSDPGYDGGMELLTAEDIQKVRWLAVSQRRKLFLTYL